MSENPTWKIQNPCWKNQHGKSDTKKELLNKQEPIIKKDIDDDGSATSNDWENDFDYLAFRKRFVNAGADDIKDHQKHYERFKEAVNTIGFSKLLQFAEQYIAEQKENSQICWFIAGGWKNYLPKKTIKASGQKGVVAKAVLMQQQQELQQEQAAGSTLSEEEKEERRRRIQAKLANLDAVMTEKMKRDNGLDWSNSESKARRRRFNFCRRVFTRGRVHCARFLPLQIAIRRCNS